MSESDNWRQFRCRFLSLRFGRLFPPTISLGDGVIKNQGFQVSESRQNHVRLNVSNWMMMGALTGRSETGSETEQVGSGMNGRRRS
jgi:hypothetical protein